MKKRMKIMIIALTVVFGGIILFNLIKGFMIKRYFAHMELPAVTVSSVIAQNQVWEPHIPSVGNFKATNGVDVSSQVAGKVVAIHFESGQFIKKDQPLIDINDDVEQASLKYNQAALTLHQMNYNRQVDLAKRGATSTSLVDEARAKLDQAQADVEKTQALIDQKHIKAPFSGQLGIRKVSLGQYITPGDTAIVTLQTMDPLFLEFYLPEQQATRISINQPIVFSVEQNPGQLFHGKITAINSKINSDTHTIQVQATVPNAKKQNAQNHTEQFIFVPGMFASIEVKQPAQSDAIVLPISAISWSLYGNSVFVIEKHADILQVKRVFISTGEQQGNQVVVKQGIKAGQMVVATGELKLQDGTRVTINNDIVLEPIKNTEALGQ